ncbi:MAG: YeeE/YedE thiosulfate transporter family protein [Pseudomonadota bacterium]
MTEFTPLASFAGGALIGLSAVILMAVTGRIAGISGIVGRLLPPVADDWGWRFSFVVGLIAAPVLVWAVTGSPPVQTVSDNLVLMAAGGLLVGFGSAYGNGCTSGHGVCGLARFSIRSLTAVGTFMVAAALTVFVVRHVPGGLQ